MAVNLNPGADQTLVSAAYRASMANVPKDLSGTYKAMAENYASTMQTVGKAWGEVAKQVGKYAGQAIQTHVKNRSYEALGSTYMDENNTAFLTDELQNIKSGLWQSWSEGDIFGNENRAKRIKLRQQRDRIFADIDLLNSGVNDLGDVLENNNYSGGGTGELNMRVINAGQSLKTPSGRTDDGDFLMPGRGKNGVLEFTLFNEDEKGNKTKVLDANGESIVVDPSEYNNLLTVKNEASLTGANNIFEKYQKLGTQNASNWKDLSSRFRNEMNGTVSNQNDLHYMMNETIWNFKSTFEDDIKGVGEEFQTNGGSVTSATLWSALGNKLPVHKDTKEALALDMSAGDPKKLDEADFANADNYNKIVDAITNKRSKYYDEDTTKSLFLDWAEQGGSSAFTYGTGFRKTNVSPNKITKNPYEIKGYENIKAGNNNMTGNVAIKVQNDMTTGDVTDPRDGSTYTWKGDGWYGDGEIVAKDNDTFAKDVLQIMDKRFYGIPNPTGGSGGLGIIEDTSKKYKGYGPKLGKQTVKSSNILSSLQSFDSDLKTVGDLETFLGKIESNSDLKQKLIEHLNKEMNSNIDIDFADDMIRDLIGNTKKKLK